jgi:hypothetical protein
MRRPELDGTGRNWTDRLTLGQHCSYNETYSALKIE